MCVYVINNSREMFECQQEVLKYNSASALLFSPIQPFSTLCPESRTIKTEKGVVPFLNMLADDDPYLSS